MAWRPIIVQSRTYWREALIGILLLAIIVGSIATCRYNRPGVSKKNQTTIDSLNATAPAHDSSRAATLTSESANTVTSQRQGLTVTRYVAVASREHAIADSLMRAAIAERDTATQIWRAAYESRTREADTLRVALDTAKAQVKSEHAARLDADRRAGLDSSRLVAVQKLALGLEADAHKAANCRILAIIPCATRTQVAVVTFVATSAAASYIVATRKR